MLAPEEYSVILNSNPLSGSTNLSADGSSFQVNLQEPIRIPKEAVNASLSLDQASIWWSIPNVVEGVNNKLFVHGFNTAGTEADFEVTIPTGLYDLNSLNNTIQQQLENLDGIIKPHSNVSIAADDATQKVVMLFNYPEVTVDFTQAQTMRTILGFDSEIKGPFTGAPEYLLGDSPAAFNSINSFLVHTDIVDQGILLNNSYSQIIGNVLIDVSPGSQITYAPFNPPKIAMSSMVGGSKDFIKVWLSDENNNAVNLNGEHFTVRLTIRYLIPMFVDHK